MSIADLLRLTSTLGADVIGKKIESVVLSPDKEIITFSFLDGASKSFKTEGDCCSQSWIEHLEMPSNVVGATLLSIEDSAPVITPELQAEIEARQGHDDYIQVYNTTFHTDRGDIVLEYRNSSNGYYGGYLVEAA